MKLKKIALSLTCCALIALLIPSVIPSVFACGKVTGGGHGKVGEQVRTPAGSFGFNAMWGEKTGLKGELEYVDHTTGDKVHAHELAWLDVWEPNPPNKPYPRQFANFGGWCTINGEGGEGVYSFVVQVEDNGEPGTSDKFFIAVYSGWLGTLLFTGGSLDDPILVGNIQIHKPMP
jgi:hypothetical protein